MLRSDEILRKLRILGTLRSVVASFGWQLLYADEIERSSLSEDFEDYLEAVLLVSSSLGLDVEAPDVIPSQPDPDDLVSLILGDSITDEALGLKVQQQYGEFAAFNFSLSQLMTGLTHFSFVFGQIDLRQTPKSRRLIIRKQLEEAHEALTACGRILDDYKQKIDLAFGKDFTRQCHQVASFLRRSTKTRDRFQQAHTLLTPPVNSLFPDFFLVDERLKQARVLIGELKSCPPGLSHSRHYEEICIRILRFLFVPPFKQIMVQAATAGRYERRDAILPNIPQTGFWRLIREEFQSKHVVCEFKNKGSSLSKKDVDQLRIYLSKPSVGRFGLLIARSACSESVRHAQRDAYEHLGALILVLNDRIVESMLKARAFIGHAEDVLEYNKARFEIEY